MSYPRITFKQCEKEQLFLAVLSERVTNYFSKTNQSKYGNHIAQIKATLLLSTYLITSSSILVAKSLPVLYLMYATSGMLTIFVALNIAHDAAHGTLSKKQRRNNFLLHTFDLLGASGYMWKLKHVYSHHPHVNIPDKDGDIKQSNLVRIFPNAQFLKFHKYQHIYMPILYAFYTIVWLLFRDFRDFFNTDISGKPNVKHDPIEFLKLFLGKVIFLSRFLILPALICSFSFSTILFGFFIFHICASYTVALALISAHVGEHSVYPSPDKSGSIDHSWAYHQMITTCDFATQNPIITHLFGSFNHHVAHHLYPNICHIHYPAITQILKEISEEYGMPYQENHRLWDAVKSHFKFLKMRSKQQQSVHFLEM